jgi:hypothetical protein
LGSALVGRTVEYSTTADLQRSDRVNPIAIAYVAVESVEHRKFWCWCLRNQSGRWRTDSQENHENSGHHAIVKLEQQESVSFETNVRLSIHSAGLPT